MHGLMVVLRTTDKQEFHGVLKTNDDGTLSVLNGRRGRPVKIEAENVRSIKVVGAFAATLAA